jgi:hypothetical protein
MPDRPHIEKSPAVPATSLNKQDIRKLPVGTTVYMFHWKRLDRGICELVRHTTRRGGYTFTKWLRPDGKKPKSLPGFWLFSTYTDAKVAYSRRIEAGIASLQRLSAFPWCPTAHQEPQKGPVGEGKTNLEGLEMASEGACTYTEEASTYVEEPKNGSNSVCTQQNSEGGDRP